MLLPSAAPVPTSAFEARSRRLLWRLAQQRGLCVIGGHPQTTRLAHYFAAVPLLRGESVLVLDAANSFNPHRLAAVAARCRQEPQEWLERVRLSRAFTCFQLAELVERVPAAARRYGVRLVVVTGVPDIFDDEEIAAGEAQQVFRRSLESLRRCLRFVPVVLVFSDEPARRSVLRGWLERQLQRQARSAYHLAETPVGLALQPAPQRAVLRRDTARTPLARPVAPVAAGFNSAPSPVAVSFSPQRHREH